MTGGTVYVVVLSECHVFDPHPIWGYSSNSYMLVSEDDPTAKPFVVEVKNVIDRYEVVPPPKTLSDNAEALNAGIESLESLLAPESHPCAVCGEAQASRCASCHAVNFCGQKCFAAVCEGHKPFCEGIMSASSSAPDPGPARKRVLIVSGLGYSGQNARWIKGAGRNEGLAECMRRVGLVPVVLDTTLSKIPFAEVGITDACTRTCCVWLTHLRACASTSAHVHTRQSLCGMSLLRG